MPLRTLVLVTLAWGCAAQQPLAESNVALNKPATGSLSCNQDEGPEKAFNGSTSGGTSDKWCSLEESKWLQVDLGADFRIDRIVIRHAGAGGEAGEWNTRAFKLHISTDGRKFTTVANVTDNDKDVSTHEIAPATARYVQLEVVTPTQDGDPAARIYEVEVYGRRD